jgi:hypothetical protein
MNNGKQILQEELERLQEDIIFQQKEVNAWASGETAKGYSVKVENDFHGTLEGYSYVGVLARGRKAGKVPFHFNEIIKRWILAKGLQYKDERDLNRMASSIAWVIHKKGSQLHRNGHELDVFDTPLRNFADRMGERLSVMYREQIINEIWQK